MQKQTAFLKIFILTALLTLLTRTTKAEAVLDTITPDLVFRVDSNYFISRKGLEKFASTLKKEKILLKQLRTQQRKISYIEDSHKEQIKKIKRKFRRRAFLFILFSSLLLLALLLIIFILL